MCFYTLLCAHLGAADGGGAVDLESGSVPYIYTVWGTILKSPLPPFIYIYCIYTYDVYNRRRRCRRRRLQPPSAELDRPVYIAAVCIYVCRYIGAHRRLQIFYIFSKSDKYLCNYNTIYYVKYIHGLYDVYKINNII